MIESLLVAVTRVSTMSAGKTLTGATGFFFERDDRLYLVTSRHVVLDEASNHRPDRLEIELHVDPKNIAESEHAALKRLTSLIKERDPDVIEGHNLFKFDLPFLVARARKAKTKLDCGAAEDDSSVKLYSLPSRH